MMWHSTVSIDRSPHAFTHADKILSLGSCFADEMGKRLFDLQFDINVNPFGVLYNPVSIAHSFGLISGQKTWTENQSFFHENKWRHFDFHSRVSKADQNEFIAHVHSQMDAAQRQLEEAVLVLLTFGTAFVWENSGGDIVGNCHKIPAKEFNRRLLKPDEISMSINGIYDNIRSINKSCKIVITVSPIRHIRDGLIQNNWSKARLLDACHSISFTNPDITYFPSYEILIDELRDYRFYTKDRCHPTEEATDYIFSKFFDSYFYSVSPEAIKLIQRINSNLKHRPTVKDSENHRRHLEQTNLLAKKLEKEHNIKMRKLF